VLQHPDSLNIAPPQGLLFTLYVLFRYAELNTALRNQGSMNFQ